MHGVAPLCGTEVMGAAVLTAEELSRGSPLCQSSLLFSQFAETPQVPQQITLPTAGTNSFLNHLNCHPDSAREDVPPAVTQHRFLCQT